MSQILRDLSAPALVVAIKANLFEWYRYLGTSPGAEFHDSPELTWLMAGIPHPFVNTVLRTQVAPEDVHTTVEGTLGHFRSRGVPFLSWWTEPGTRPADLDQHLVAHGLTYTDGGPGMALDLWELTEDLPVSSAVTIEPVADAESLQEWASASMVGFGLPEASIQPWFELFSGLGFDLPLRNYVARLDGQPVAASELFLGSGVAGIYVVATVPQVRRQGIGAAVTSAPLREARAMGYRVAILHSSDMGLGVYRQLGFREYCRMPQYLWSAG
jgi:GNAT superfamily N-acetyltransferase